MCLNYLNFFYEPELKCEPIEKNTYSGPQLKL